MDPIFQKRYKYFVIAQIIAIQAGFSYILFGNAMIKIPSEYQWMLGLFSGIMRDFFLSVVLNFSSKSLGTPP